MKRLRMVSIFSFLLLFHMIAYAKSGYSIQILSRPVNHSPSFDLSRMDPSCYRVVREGFEAIRCGCVERFDRAKKELFRKYRQRYKGAFIANCDRRAYKLRQEKRYPVTKMKKRRDRPKESQSAKRYSIQILSAPTGEHLFKKVSLSSGCYKVTREHFDAIRCGCYDDYNEAKKSQTRLKQNYKTAFIANCDLSAYRRYKKHMNVVENPYTKESSVKKEKSRPKKSMKAQTRSTEQKQTLLDKLYLSFVYSHDLVHAQQVVDLGLRQGKTRVKWLKRGIDVAMWLGESDRAMHLMRQLYRLTGDWKIKKRLLDYSLQSYRYQEALYLMLEHPRRHWKPQDVDTIAYLYQQVGDPEKAIEFLYRAWRKEPNQRKWLLDAIQIALNLGEIDKASEMVNELQKRGIETLRGAELVSYYYFIKRDPQKAYITLLKFNPNLLKDRDEKLRYYRKLSDLGWLVGDYRRAMQASYYLIQRGAAIQSDYNRVILAATRDNPKLALNVAIEAFEKYKTEYYFYSAAYLAEQLKDYERLADLFSIVDEYHLNDQLSQKADYYLILSDLDIHLKNPQAARKDLQNAFELAPDDPKVLSQLMWFYYDNYLIDDLKKMTVYVENRFHPVDYSLYPVLIAAHMKLQQSDLARFYMRKLYRYQNRSLNIDEKVGLAYLLQQQMRMNYYKYQMLKLYRELEKERINDKNKMNDPLFADAWLRAAMEFVNPDIFEKRLKAAKRVLSTNRYKEIGILWDIRLGEYDRVNKELYKWEHAEPWMVLSLALYNHDLTTMQDMLYRYGEILPIRDRVLAARKDRQIALAQTFAFKGMEENRWDYLLFYQREQLMRSESDRFALGGYCDNRDSLTRSRLVFRNRNKLPRGWSLSEKAQYVRNSGVDHGKLRHVPDDQKGVDVALTKRFDRGTITASGGYRNAMDTYFTGSVSGEWILMQRWHAEAGYYYHEDTEDTTYLMLGGYQNRVHVGVDYKLLNSTTLQGHGDYLQYRGQDDKGAGDGWKTGLSLYHVFRTGYPDIQMSLYTEYGQFNQKLNQEGVLRKLMPHPEYETATPADYFIVGGGLYLGYQNYSDYIRAWRWYAGINPYYDYKTDEGSVGGEVGVGGSLFQQDHLDLGIQYTPAFYNGQESLTTLYFLYRMMY